MNRVIKIQFDIEDAAMQVTQEIEIINPDFSSLTEQDVVDKLNSGEFQTTIFDVVDGGLFQVVPSWEFVGRVSILDIEHENNYINFELINED